MSEYLLPYQPSLGSATGTRVDSACKHHHQCRVSTDDLLKMTVPKNNTDELVRNKYRYCAHKDELIVGFGRPWSSDEARKVSNNAYPRVTSNLAMWDGTNDESTTCIKMLKYMCHYARSLVEKKMIVEWFKSMNDDNEQKYNVQNQVARFFKMAADNGTAEDNTRAFIGLMYDFVPMGFAQTLGYAHMHSGDTMTTVMIGGLRTVMNGDFEVFTGDIIQWYWPFERDCFLADGRRKRIGNSVEYTNGQDPLHCNIDPSIDWTTDEDGNFRQINGKSDVQLEKDANARLNYHSKTFGMPQGTSKMVARIKPYWRDDENFRMYDHMRVFAVAIGCARPHEMVDIKISRQSL